MRDFTKKDKPLNHSIFCHFSFFLCIFNLINIRRYLIIPNPFGKIKKFSTTGYFKKRYLVAYFALL